MITYVLALVCGLLILSLDQLTKYIVSSTFSLGETKEFLNGFIEFCFVENPGSAWGMLAGKTYLLIGFTAIAMAACIFYYIKYGNKNRLLLWAISLVVSGGIGNMIDRVFRGGKVIDFLHFEFFPTFPVFNIADCAVVIGSGLFILYVVLDMIKESKSKKESADGKD